MNILTEGKDCYQKTKVNTMQRTSSVALFHGKSLKFIGYLGILGLLAGASLSTAAARERDLLDAGWTFQIGDPVDVTTAVTSYPEIGDLTKLQDPTAEVTLEASRPDPVATHAGENVSYVQTNYNDSAWRQLNLPHDWVVEQPFDSNMAQNHGYKAGFNNATSTNTIAWYRHTFTLPAGDTNKTMWLEFDGIYRNALIWLNGRCIGRDVSGYAPISFDVTSNMIAGGTNVLVVRVDASRFEGWFYEGAGIYRHVWLEKTAPVHVGHWGTYVATTSLVGSNATITVQTAVTNQSSSATVNGTLTSTLLDANSNAVTAVTSNLNLAIGQGVIVTQTLAVANANLWSLQTPYLYNLISTVSNATAQADVYQTPFGVRTVRFDSTNGVFINGQHVEIQGQCNHQDHAGVGSALPDRLQYFRIEKLKEMGCNAYRTSHNTPTEELLEACDQLGMLVLDETRRMGSDPESLGQLQRMVLRDRNHPSVFCWSLCNEEWTMQGSSLAPAVIQAMQNLVHSLDTTRLCTAAINGSLSGVTFAYVLDVKGLNYNIPGNLDSYHPGNPTAPIIGTEVGSTVTTRGIYTNDTVNGYVASYDFITQSGLPDPVTWGETAETWWPIYTARPWASGGFNWTGFDYRGEPTPYNWPCINSHFGQMDTCGFPKDLFYYYQANWTLKPVLHVFPHWNWTPGQPINVWAYGNCQAVELFVNGASQGKQTLNVQGHVEWDNVTYAAGTLQAIGYNNGVAVITNTAVTTGTPAAIALLPDRSTILADGRDVSIVTVAVLDSLGRVVPSASNNVTFTISGGAIIGVGNGNPSSHEADKASNQRMAFNGLAEVIVQSTNQAGSITLAASATGLTPTNITITAAATLPAPAAPTGVAAIAGNSQVVVSWDVVPGATTYNLWRATTSGGPYTLIAGNIGGVNLGYTDSNVTILTTYYYVVTANGNGTSVNSAEVSASPTVIVSGLTASVVGSQVQLQWNTNNGVTGYNVKRSAVSGGPYTLLAANLGATNYTDSSAATCQTNFYVVTITNAGNESLPSAEVSAILTGLPPQFTSADIGSPSPAGSASFCGGQFTISGGGADIWGNADAFQFVYVYVPISTNCDIRARVVSVQNTSNNAKAAVMIRETLAAGSRRVLADVEPVTSTGIEFIWRATNNGASSSSSVTGQTAPNWVRLTRTNNTFTAYYSGNGTTWTQIGTPTNITMSVSAYVGLAVCSHNTSSLCTSLIDSVNASFLTTNMPPVISWVVPTNNSTFIQPNTITLTASATDADGTVTNVAFFNGATLLGNVTTGVGNQYSLTWSNAAVGSYTLSASATDNSGATNTSPATITIVVQPLTLTVNGTQTSGQFGLTFQGQNGQNYVLLTSTNLMTGWTPVWTNAPINGLLMFTNANATDQARFYRVSQ
jgi:beta-galactosidase